VILGLMVVLVVAAGRVGVAQAPGGESSSDGPAATPLGPLDPMAQAVVDSLLVPERREPDALLAAAIRAADVEAVGVATLFLRRLADAVTEAGDARTDLLADLADRFDDGSLDRLLRLIGPATASDREGAFALVRGMRSAAAARRRDPERMAAAVNDLGADDLETRAAAAATLNSAGIDALPLLLPLLDDRTVKGRLARELVASLGYEGVDTALGILGSGDLEAWPAALHVLRLLRPDPERVEARERVEAARREVDDLEAEVAQEIHHWVTRAESARLRAELASQTLLPRIRAAQDATTAALAGGTGDLREALDLRRQGLEAAIDHAAALRDQWLAIAELLLLCGWQELPATVPSSDHPSSLP